MVAWPRLACLNEHSQGLLVKSTLSKDFLQPHSGSFLIEGKFNNYLHVTYKKTTCSLFPERL